MLDAILKLLPKLGPVLAASQEVADLIDQAKAILSDDEGDVLEEAYALAKSRSDSAHADLQALVASRT